MFKPFLDSLLKYEKTASKIQFSHIANSQKSAIIKSQEQNQADGDIVSVCKNMNSTDRGSDLLKRAIENDGDRLDAFGPGLYSFYTKNGFEPVSWTPFNEEYAPHDWDSSRDAKEPVVFYRYTGKKTEMSFNDFIRNIPKSTEILM